ncbi:hypothetical protein PLICRDRAFT_125796 [Plicaturopsis crispa FD-325 SS-3]|nr:hypothetical protein PLICRDRAFT_125796 [Plicaturopsis crispa FD-325 SS-3]
MWYKLQDMCVSTSTILRSPSVHTLMATFQYPVIQYPVGFSPVSPVDQAGIESFDHGQIIDWLIHHCHNPPAARLRAIPDLRGGLQLVAACLNDFRNGMYKSLYIHSTVIKQGPRGALKGGRTEVIKEHQLAAIYVPGLFTHVQLPITDVLSAVGYVLTSTVDRGDERTCRRILCVFTMWCYTLCASRKIGFKRMPDMAQISWFETSRGTTELLAMANLPDVSSMFSIFPSLAQDTQMKREAKMLRKAYLEKVVNAALGYPGALDVAPMQVDAVTGLINRREQDFGHCSETLSVIWQWCGIRNMRIKGVAINLEDFYQDWKGRTMDASTIASMGRYEKERCPNCTHLMDLLGIIYEDLARKEVIANSPHPPSNFVGLGEHADPHGYGRGRGRGHGVPLPTRPVYYNPYTLPGPAPGRGYGHGEPRGYDDRSIGYGPHFYTAGRFN